MDVLRGEERNGCRMLDACEQLFNEDDLPQVIVAMFNYALQVSQLGSILFIEEGLAEFVGCHLLNRIREFRSVG